MGQEHGVSVVCDSWYRKQGIQWERTHLRTAGDGHDPAQSCPRPEKVQGSLNPADDELDGLTRLIATVRRVVVGMRTEDTAVGTDADGMP